MSRHRRAEPPWWLLWRAARLKLALLLALAVWMVLGGAGFGTGMDVEAHVHPGTAARLIAEHECWTGRAPDDVVVPGHAVVTLPNGKVRYVRAKGLGRALEQVFSPAADTGLRVHAFCR